MKNPSKLISAPARLAAGLLCVSGMICASHAAESATGQISNQSLGGGVYDYTILLNNTGTTQLGTFWFSWVPGQNFMPAIPSNISAPSGWQVAITSGPGYGIQFVTVTAPLAAGQSINFSFDSSVTPAQMAGSAFGSPVGTSFVYTGVPLSDPGYEFVVQSVPEPSAPGLLLTGWFGWLLVSRRMRAAPVRRHPVEPRVISPARS